MMWAREGSRRAGQVLHTIKPGTLEHGAPVEHRNTSEQWQSTPETEHQRSTPEYQRNTNVTPAEEQL